MENNMQEYKVKRTVIKELENNISSQLTECFGVTPQIEKGHYWIQFGILEKLEVWVGETKKTIIVNTVTKEGIEDDELILDTNRRFRKYLDAVTGYKSKERAKNMKSIE